MANREHSRKQKKKEREKREAKAARPKTPRRPSFNPANMLFIQGSAFYEIARIVRTPGLKQDTVHLAFAEAVIAAFAGELFLKCLHHIRHGDAPWLHDLQILFGGCEPSDQMAVTKNYNDIMHHIDAQENLYGQDMSIDGVLARCADMFEEVRYIHQVNPADWDKDANGKTGTFGLGPLVTAIRKTIVDLRPRWEERFILSKEPGGAEAFDSLMAEAKARGDQESSESSSP